MGVDRYKNGIAWSDQSCQEILEPTLTTPRTTLAFCSTAHAFTHAIELSFPVLLLFLQDEFDQTGYGLLAAIYAGSLLLFGVGGLPFGILSDRWGGLSVILLGIGLSLVGAVLAILAGEAGSIALFALAMMLMGVGISTYHPAGLWALSAAYPKGKGRSHAMGIHGFGGSFGQFLAPVLAGLGAVILGWQYVYGALIFLGVGLATIGLPIWRRTGTRRVKRPPSSDVDGLPLEQEQLKAKTETKGNGAKVWNLRSKAIGMKQGAYYGALRDLWCFSIAVVVAITILRGLFYRGTSAFIPALAHDEWGLSAESGGLILSISLVAGSLGQLSGGWSHGRFGPKWPLVGFASLSLVALALMLTEHDPHIVDLSIADLDLKLPLGIGFAGMVLFGFAFFGGQPVVNAHIADVTPEEVRGLFFGFTFATRFGLASVATGFVGWAADWWGIPTALTLMFIPIALAILAPFLLGLDEDQKAS